MFKGFEQGRNLEGPASTGWLIVSIIFASKLWIGDVTSMSLYWVARLPIERPKGQTSHAPRTALPAPGRSRRQWKIALSLAIFGALASSADGLRFASPIRHFHEMAA